VSRWRELLLAAAGVATVPAALLLVEAVLALAERGPREPAPPPLHRLHRYSEAYGWEPRPGARIEQGGASVAINERGCRGRLVDPRERAAPVRAVLLGDSIAFGLGVSEVGSFAGLLDARDNGLELVNLAVQGYGPCQSLLRLEGEGLGYRPDVVLFSLCLGNDFADAVLPVSLYDGRHPKPFFTLEAGRLVKHDAHLRLSPRRRAALWLADHSRLFARLTQGAPEAEATATSWLARRREALRDRERALSVVVALVARMHAVSREAGAEFFLLLHPDRDLIDGRTRWIDGLLTSSELAAVRRVDLREHYARRGLDYAAVAADRIGHLSAAGHLETALIIEELLAEAGLARRGPKRG
jgi:hypothetical protein